MFDWTVKRFRAPYCLGIEHKSRQSKIDLACLLEAFCQISNSLEKRQLAVGAQVDKP
ncbi:hypothetical protein T4E_8711 [Trichinella pseudospiralis]|uniref:Uncharacterized protein n=1 Tax=Trichinella pseudospiralis TaxID=6337 RepID=A0A0V0XT64_TRIPS|nr:hypothetical protein T4E_8711 [Trichinella pseudospiralis]